MEMGMREEEMEGEKLMEVRLYMKLHCIEKCHIAYIKCSWSKI